MNVWWVRYAWEKSWGFGPGGSYTGIIVYDMPEAVKTELLEKGLAWLNALSPNTSPGASDSVGDWRELGRSRMKLQMDGPQLAQPSQETVTCSPIRMRCPSISGFMGGYGLLSFDRDFEVMANEALFSPRRLLCLRSLAVHFRAREPFMTVALSWPWWCILLYGRWLNQGSNRFHLFVPT